MDDSIDIGDIIDDGFEGETSKKLQKSGSSNESGSIHLNNRLTRFLGISPGEEVKVELVTTNDGPKLVVSPHRPFTLSELVDLANECGWDVKHDIKNAIPTFSSNNKFEFDTDAFTVSSDGGSKFINISHGNGSILAFNTSRRVDGAVLSDCYVYNNTIEIETLGDFRSMYRKTEILNSNIPDYGEIDTFDSSFSFDEFDISRAITDESVIFTFITQIDGKNRNNVYPNVSNVEPIEVSKLKSKSFTKSKPNRYGDISISEDLLELPTRYHPIFPNALGEYMGYASDIYVTPVAITSSQCIPIDEFDKIPYTMGEVY